MRRIVRGLFVASCLLITVSCFHRVSVGVSGSSSDCQMFFEGPLLRRKTYVHEISVYKNNFDSVLICSLRAVHGDHELSEWVYGTAPLGFVLEECGPLAVGGKYAADVAVAGGAGIRDSESKTMGPLL